jgi:hypothetical protein
MFFARQRAVIGRDRATMKTPVALVATALTVAILIAASFLIATKTHGENRYGENTLWQLTQPPRHAMAS